MKRMQVEAWFAAEMAKHGEGWLALGDWLAQTKESVFKNYDQVTIGTVPPADTHMPGVGWAAEAEVERKLLVEFVNRKVEETRSRNVVG